MPDDGDIDKRLTVLEATLRDAARSQRMGNLLSLGLLGFAVYQWWTRPPPLRVFVVEDDVPPGYLPLEDA